MDFFCINGPILIEAISLKISIIRRPFIIVNIPHMRTLTQFRWIFGVNYTQRNLSFKV